MAKKPTKLVEQRKARVAIIVPLLRSLYPQAKCSLDFKSPLELVVATILSAQCTDARVNIVTKTLFKKYRSAADYAQAVPEELEKDIQSTGFYRNKAKSIIAMAKALIDHHGGQVPDTMSDLVKLAGVGRKTANVVLGNAFGHNEGIAVDTHVTRVANRLGLTKHPTDAVKIELDLMPLMSPEHWTELSHLLIFHGRHICDARKPACERCPLFSHCPAGPKILKARTAATR
jgi:endonuclease III